MRLTRRHERGQSLIEFAVVFPVFMFMLGGVIQFGMVFWGQNTINQVIRDGGRYAATVATCDGSAASDVQTQTAALADGTIIDGTITVSAPVWTAPACPTTNADAVFVTVAATAEVPIFFPFVPGDGTVSSQAKYRMEPQIP